MSEAEYEDRIRVLRSAFEDSLLTLEEMGRADVADRLRMRWPEALGSEPSVVAVVELEEQP